MVIYGLSTDPRTYPQLKNKTGVNLLYLMYPVTGFSRAKLLIT